MAACLCPVSAPPLPPNEKGEGLLLLKAVPRGSARLGRPPLLPLPLLQPRHLLQAPRSPAAPPLLLPPPSAGAPMEEWPRGFFRKAARLRCAVQQ
jgi:hypothetical protein